jgi:hypothetical protein
MRLVITVVSFSLIIVLSVASGFCQELEATESLLPYLLPPENVRSADTPNDRGGSITLNWDTSPDDSEVGNYEILRCIRVDGEYSVVGTVSGGSVSFIDTGVSDRESYFYKVRAVAGDRQAESNPTDRAQSSPQWFNRSRLNMLIALVVFCGFVLWFIYRAKIGRELFVRKISGLDAVEDAIGRATEMGRSVLYIPGIGDMDNIQTIASMVILGRVAKKVAEYDVTLQVPVSRSLVMTTAQEVVKESYSAVGRPDAYKADNIHYLTDDQFGYAAGVDGIMIREKPATVFLLGAFYAESLILAETGHSVGAIQIAGTAMPAQLPFFVAACDYTLIGEELFAASAYLSKEPLLMGSLKGQDWGKAVFMALIGIGVILETMGITYLARFLVTR